MTWYLDRETGDVYDHNGSKVGTVDGPPYTIPEDVKDVLWDSFPSDDASVSVDELKGVLDVADGGVEFGTPPEQ
jgi:hypothetical protein